MSGRRILLTGAVQGVGFRPFVLRLAGIRGITGSVGNDSAGVVIEAFGPKSELAQFVEDLQQQSPPAARIRSLRVEPLKSRTPHTMTVVTSTTSPGVDEVTPDLACCRLCAAEVGGESRRSGFAYNSCADCGPRFSVTLDLPFDRPTTSMREFGMCQECRAEYDDPEDRRFWAQTISCPTCGPQPSLWLSDGSAGGLGRAAIEQARQVLDEGNILAVKGTGGYQLMAEVSHPDSVARIRERKARPTRPLAVVLPTAMLHVLEPGKLEMLGSAEAPILITGVPEQLRTSYPGLAPGLNEWGVMLPNAPLHHLLLEGRREPVICTSANPRGQPMVVDDELAKRELFAFADAILTNDRTIQHRVDDSIRRDCPGVGTIPMRRGRGQVPIPIPCDLPGNVIGVGADMKAAFGIVRNQQLTASQHFGDLMNAPVLAAFESELSDWMRLYGCNPELVVCDRHPDYVSTQYAERLAAKLEVPLLRAQHHRAHIAAVLAEHQVAPDKVVVGVALDGLGYGDDGNLWGGEVFVGPGRDLRHGCGFKSVALAGLDRASLEPWLMAASYLSDAGIVWQEHPAFATVASTDRDACAAQLAVPALKTSALGRLLDAVSFMLGLVPPRAEYDGRAPALLEALASRSEDAEALPYRITSEGERLTIDTVPAWRVFVERLGIVPPAVLARQWHHTIVSALVAVINHLAEEAATSDIVLSGGCMQNVLLRQALQSRLEKSGKTVLALDSLPTNDGSLGAGQAWLGAALLEANRIPGATVELGR